MPLQEQDLAPQGYNDSPGAVDVDANYIGVTVKPPKRTHTLVDSAEKTVKNLIKIYRDNLEDRAIWTEQRIQRTAKYRGWRETKSFPWPDASNQHLPIIMTDVQRTEDTLHNAVLSTHPVMNAKGASPEFEPKEKTIDNLIDHQVFVENQGEQRIGNLISSFCQDGMWVAYCPYIREKQKTTRTYNIEYPGANISWDAHIMQSLAEYYPKAIILPGSRAPWNWVLREDNPLTGKTVEYKVEVYQECKDHDQVQLVCHHNDAVFDGPALIPIELEDIVVPTRAENLQPRTMSNPTGASHVIMVDYPSKDEIKRLYKSGFYDEMTAEDLEKLEAVTLDPTQASSTDPQSQKLLQDDLSGAQLSPHGTDDKASVNVTRLTFFGREDLDGDGLEEEVVYWLIESPQILLRVRYLTEVFPVFPMRRPFAMAKYIPVNGQFYAIGLIELMESGYDIIKKTFDQMIDNGDVANTPWGFYRPMSGIRPEKIRMGPGDLYPTNSPKDDVYYPQLPQGSGVFGQNIITMVSQILDQVTLVGSLQLGGVPQGKSSALRTTSNMQALLQQGDARPERVLRRFFSGLVEIWQQFHELNQIFLPKEKSFRIMRGQTPNTNPYIKLDDKSQISGRFLFDFTASILNTNRALASAALESMLAGLINPLMLQMQIVTPENAYNLVRDWIKTKGQEPASYITAPPGADPFAGPAGYTTRRESRRPVRWHGHDR